MSLVVVAVCAALGGQYVRYVVTENFLSVTQQSHEVLVQQYVSGVWKKYRDVIVPLASDPERMRGNPQVAQFAQETVLFFQKTPLIRVNLYGGNGLLLMTDNVSVVTPLLGTAATPDKVFVTAMLNTLRSSSQLVRDVPLRGVEHGMLAQTLLPIRVEGLANQPPDGTVEILYDMTATYNQLLYLQAISTAAIIGVFSIFLLIIAVGAKKAEAIISKQHEANIELAETAATALAENKDKSQFLANISHELRTPLNAIIGFSDIIKRELLPQLAERKYDQYLHDIHSAGVHLLSLINDILDYSKAEAGKLSLEVSEVDVTKMVQNCMRLVSPRAESGDVHLVEEMPKEHIIMIIDGKKFKQILLNLLSNAVKFTPTGGTVSVTAWTNMMEDTITFMVVDTGIGIAPKDISRAMSPFGQIDNTLKRKYEGTGLGLPLTKKFVELMGGKFGIESEVGKGTKVIFTLPRETKDRDGVTVKHEME